jgi:seryl-tRNA synthetase
MTVLPSPSGLRARLVEAGLLFPTGVDGVYGRSDAYQAVVGGIGRLVHGWAARLGATTVHLPPVLPRSTFDATAYMASFPDLAGSVHVFAGDDRMHAELLRRLEHDGHWPALLEPGEVVLPPAACHGLYPMCAGRLPDGGRFYEVTAYCFRHEPSADPTRMQAFQMHEVVYLGDPAGAERHRDQGLSTAVALLERLGLDIEPAPANDPFFGRLGAALAVGQRDERLKFEGLATIEPGEPPVAVLSANCHRDHFGGPFRIEAASGAVAHSACVGFGVDRIAIALFSRHGVDPVDWPPSVREELSW